VNKVFEPRIRAQWIEARPQQDAWVKSLFVGFFEPIHRLVTVPERRINRGNFRTVRIGRV
jgi:hypothetical protein